MYQDERSPAYGGQGSGVRTEEVRIRRQENYVEVIRSTQGGTMKNLRRSG